MGTGGLANIAFTVMDVVQRELGTDLFRGVRPAVLCCRLTPAIGPGIYQHVDLLATVTHALESRDVGTEGTDSRCSLGYLLQGQAIWDLKSQTTAVLI